MTDAEFNLRDMFGLKPSAPAPAPSARAAPWAAAAAATTMVGARPECANKRRKLRRREASSSPELAVSSSEEELELTRVVRATLVRSVVRAKVRRQEYPSLGQVRALDQGRDPDGDDDGDDSNSSEQGGPESPAPDPGGVYDVEAVVEERASKKTGAPEFLVKWIGFPESENTWEPAEHLTT